MVEMEEVKRVVFQLGGNKAASPDSFPGFFYHRFWNVLGDDVFHSVKSFFETGILLLGYCYTNIVLIS